MYITTYTVLICTVGIFFQDTNTYTMSYNEPNGIEGYIDC